jgi:hypothetical protein
MIPPTTPPTITLMKDTVEAVALETMVEGGSVWLTVEGGPVWLTVIRSSLKLLICVLWTTLTVELGTLI